jgi:pantoate--beta-alanine ligase
VTKLLHIVEPTRAWFGAKDWQQVTVVRRMVADLDMDVDIRTVPTRREPDGLAMSSRNTRLGERARGEAPCLWRGLAAARDAHLAGESRSRVLADLVARAIASADDCRLEYVCVVHPDSLEELEDTGDGAVICAAMWCDGVRLIDNVELPASP